MANLVWTGILYGSTLGIVFMIYRIFVVDRKAENEQKTSELVRRSYGRQPAAAAEPALPSETSLHPARAGLRAVRR